MFLNQRPLVFNGMGDPATAETWVRRMDRIFILLQCTDQERMNLAAYQLDGAADHWWEAQLKTMTEEEQALLTWDDFKTAMYDKYIPESYQQMKEVEFYNLTQGKMTVTEYDRAFCDMSRYPPRVVDTGVKRTAKFCDGLRHEIRMGLACLGGLSYSKSLRRALKIEAVMPKEKSTIVAALPPPPPQQHNFRDKRKWDGDRTSHANKRQQLVRNPTQYEGEKTFQIKRGGYRPKAHQCTKCFRNHFGKCKAGTDGCYHCGESGHFYRECPNNNVGNRARQNFQEQRPQLQALEPEPRGDPVLHRYQQQHHDYEETA